MIFIINQNVPFLFTFFLLAEGELQEEEKRIGEKSKKALKKRENEKAIKSSASADEPSIGETPSSGDVILTQPKVLIA